MPDTIPAMLFQCVDRQGDKVAFHWPAPSGWKSMTWAEAATEMAGLAQGLRALGVGPGVPVAIVAQTRKEWTAVDLAVLCLGGITVGIYPTLLAEQVAWQVEHSEARVLVVEDAEQAAKAQDLVDHLPHLEHIVAIEAVDGLPSLDDVAGEQDLDALRASAQEVRPDDVATYIYTSGTTGNPKGAVLLHQNFTAVLRASQEAAPIPPGERSLIFLPLAHSLQRFAVYRGFIEDVVGYYTDGLDGVPEALQVGRPHRLATVPRMLEKIRDKANAAADEKGGVAAVLYHWAMGVGRERALAWERGQPLSSWLKLRLAIADRLVFSKVRQRTGGSLSTIISGGAALDPEVARWFMGVGVLVLEGWGLTETSAPATLNREDAFKLGTVGQPLPDVEIQIADDGEILVRGPGIFRGYLKDAEATEAVLTGDGWFYTGDVGRVDGEGFLQITDRKKEILVTAGGKNVAPVNIEKRIERSPYVAQAVALGSERPYLVALLVPDEEAIEAHASRQGWPAESLEARLERGELQALFDEAVQNANTSLARYEQIKRHHVLPAPFSVETGELTPTLKLKRRVVENKWRDEIEALYA